jgi:hypothetical protein
VTGQTLLRSWRSAPLAEIAWLPPGGPPRIDVVVPLVAGERPALALTYDRLREARGLAAARRAVLAVHAFAEPDVPLVEAELSVSEDPTGDRFSERLLAQELAKHPPSRELADSLLQRSEHWWYLPRLLVTAHPRGEAVRQQRREALAAVRTADGLRLTSVDLGGSPRAPSPHPMLPDGPATILQHGATEPDLLGRWHRRWWGTMEAGRLLLDGWEEHGAPGARPGTWRRWRDEVALSRACRAGLREAGHH